MTETSTAALLDECIDALLAGEDWRKVVPLTPPARTGIAQLMRVAAELQVTDAAWSRPALIQAAKDATRANLESHVERTAQ